MTDTISVYLIGPGVGESVVLIMPDRRVVVVDSCMRAGVNYPASVLTNLGVTQIDLLVITHPDLDHVKGIEDLVDTFRPARIWRHPFVLAREVLDMLKLGAPTRHATALQALAQLDVYLRQTGAVEQVAAGRSWPSPGASCPYTLHALAPTAYDQLRATDRIRGLVEVRGGRPTLTNLGMGWLDGSRPLGDVPNMVSLGLALEWGPRRIVLAGDIESGDGGPFSGGRGVLEYLDRPDDRRGHLVDDVDLVKVAHHGSRGAFLDEAWARHAHTSRPVGIATTYSPSRLPDAHTLTSLRARCQRLGISTDAGDVHQRAMAAG